MSDAASAPLDRHTAAFEAGDAAGLRCGVAVDTGRESTVGTGGHAARAETVNMLTQRDGKIARYLVESAAVAQAAGLGRLAA